MEDIGKMEKDVVKKELQYTKSLVETLRTRIVKSEQEVLKLKIRIRRLETKVKELGIDSP